MSDRDPPNLLGSLTSPEVAARIVTATDEQLVPTLLVPLGATEQHGPHLPIHTDTTLAAAWAAGVADRLGGCLVAPPLPYGSSGEHQSFPGTLSIGQDALRMVLIELTRSAAEHFGRVVLLSGHAGNVTPVGEACRLLRNEGHNIVHLFPSWDPMADRTGQAMTIDAHAGRTETALMLHVNQEAVRRDRLSPGRTTPISELMDMLTTAGVGSVSPSGVLGDPTGADAADGELLLRALVDRTVDVLNKI